MSRASKRIPELTEPTLLQCSKSNQIKQLNYDVWTLEKGWICRQVLSSGIPRLANARDLTIHVVGFDSGMEGRTTASCMAGETNGLFIPARTQQELEDALSRTLLCPRVTSLIPEDAPASPRRH